ncbi:MAG: alanine/ornithine racemase family PLP-dependent enzyme [Alphaproteobacteria bacterium]|nr:alanine/ornithine racemase family PLP-dependent enzyme [Alphaproteobacteria bacterium]
MSHPRIHIGLAKIAANARTIVGMCAAHGIEVLGVTKATHGDPQVARAMLAGGVTGLGESRLESIERLKAAGIDAPMTLLTVPALSEADAVVEHADVSLNSELSVLQALSDAALARGRIHDAVVMVDLGDLREGVMPDYLDGFLADAVKMTGVRIRGLGANLTCFGGVAPSPENMAVLVRLARDARAAHGLALDWVSGGNSSALRLIQSGHMPAGITHARIGEAILLGRETTHREPWPGTHQDAFVLSAEVVEVKEKPSHPVGEVVEDAFGHVPDFPDVGDMDRAILNVGREDVAVEGLTPADSRFTVLGGSSGYVIVDVTPAHGSVKVGDRLAFTLNYAALVAAMGSPHIEKIHS